MSTGLIFVLGVPSEKFAARTLDRPSLLLISSLFSTKSDASLQKFSAGLLNLSICYKPNKLHLLYFNSLRLFLFFVFFPFLRPSLFSPSLLVATNTPTNMLRSLLVASTPSSLNPHTHTLGHGRSSDFAWLYLRVNDAGLVKKV